MKIINPGKNDYHMHSSDFSDGTSTVDEIVRFVGDLGASEIAITDHSDFSLKKGFNINWNQGNTNRSNMRRRKNVFNDVKIIFGVEGDLINEDGDICSTIQGLENDFVILSAHIKVYEGKPENITKAYINAIKKHHDKIKFIGHPCNSRCFSQYVDIKKLVKVCNEYNIPMEFDATDLVRDVTDINKLHIMLKEAKFIYVNSDGHSLHEIKENRKIAFDFLKEHGYL